MKKIVYLLVAIVFFSCDRQYDNFKITGINMHAVTFNDSIRSKKRYFFDRLHHCIMSSQIYPFWGRG